MITSPASISSWTAWMVSSCFSRCCVEPRSSMARARWTGSTVQVIWNYEAVICCNTGVSWWQWHVNKHHKTSTKTREIIENSAQPSQVHHSQSFEALASHWFDPRQCIGILWYSSWRCGCLWWWRSWQEYLLSHSGHCSGLLLSQLGRFGWIWGTMGVPTTT